MADPRTRSWAIAAITCWALAAGAAAEAGLIIPGTPTADGTDTFTVTLANGTKKTVSVPVTKGMTIAAKAEAIQTAFVDAGVPCSVTATYAVKIANVSGLSSTSTSGEKDVFAIAPLPTDGPVFAQTDLHLADGMTALSGLDGDGNEAVYSSGFGLSSSSLGEISLSASLTFSQLVTPTLAGVLAQQFGILQSQLAAQAPSLLGDLTLNLAGSAIEFRPQGEFTEATVTSGSTDVATTSTMELSVVPEPSSFALAASGLALAAASRARRRTGVGRPGPGEAP